LSSNLVTQMDLAEQVGKLHLQGMNPTEIARQLSLERKYVVRALDDFRGLLRRSEESIDVRERMMDVIYEADESFRMVIHRAWEVADEAKLNSDPKNNLAALKLVESSTKARADMLQKIGVGQDDDLIDQLNKREENEAILIGLLKDIKDKHPEVAQLISDRLSRIQEEVETITVEQGRDVPAIE
jgi:hypothetical protein